MKVFLYTYLIAAISVASMGKVLDYHRGTYSKPIMYVTVGVFWPIAGVSAAALWLNGSLDNQ